MTVNELISKLKLAKNKDAEILFRLKDENLTIDNMVAIVNDDVGVHFPVLGEESNAVAIRLSSKIATTNTSE